MDQVVCIRDDWGHKPNLKAWPVVNGIYTIRNAKRIKAVYSRPPMLFYHFYEIVNPPVRSQGEMVEPIFDAEYFRPVRHTDISCFTQLLELIPV